MASLVDALAPVPTREAFKAMCHGLLRLYLERRRFMVLMVTETQRNDEVAAILAGILSGAITKARAFVQDRIDRGELRPHDPMLTVRLLQGPIFFYFLMQPRLSPPLPALEADVLVNGIVDTVLHGLLVEQEGTA
jgi:AcrR family transcriptional regulator